MPRKNSESDKSTIKVSFAEGKFVLESDELNYILKRKAGKGYAVEGYYKDLEGVLATIFAKTVRLSPAKSITALTKAINKARKDIAEYSKEIEDLLNAQKS